MIIVQIIIWLHSYILIMVDGVVSKWCVLESGGQGFCSEFVHFALDPPRCPSLSFHFLIFFSPPPSERAEDLLLRPGES